MITSHPRYNQLQTLINSLITKIGIAQATYFTQNSKYFQGLRVPTQDLNGATQVSVNWSVKPDDQLESWNAFDSTTFRTQFKIEFNIRVDVYRSPRGWGWILTVELIYPGLDPDQFGNNGSKWTYRHHEGPDPSGVLDQWYIDLNG